MAFISSNATVISFAEYSDVLERDQRLFESNEGINVVDDLEEALIKSTSRIVALLSKALGITVDINGILNRGDDFTALCVYHMLYDWLLPKVADFGEEQNAERMKIDFYQNKFNLLFAELMADGDWYDLDADLTVTESDSVSIPYQLRRVR